MKNIFNISLSVITLVIAIGFGQITANAQSVVVNYDFLSTTAGTPCAYGGPATVFPDVTSSYTSSAAACTTPAGTASTVPPAFVANASNQSVSITGFATGVTQSFTFQIGNVSSFLDYQVFFQTQRSGTGPANATLQYSLNGTTFTDFQTITVPTAFGAFNFDLSAVTAIENQPTVYFRILASSGSNVAGTFRVDNFQVQANVTTSANAQVGGRVTDGDGKGLAKVSVKISGGELSEPIYAMTNPFGYFNFEVPVGQTYIVTVQSKQYVFSNPSRLISVSDNVGDLNFVADER